MAKRRKKISGVRRKRHHRMGANMSGMLTNALAVVGGAVAAGYLNKVIPTTVNDKIVSGGKIALGLALPMLSKSGNTKQILSGVGAGMIAVGSVDLLKSFGVLSGDFDSADLSGDVLAADILSGDIPVINGDIPVINGDDDMMSGDDDMMSGDDDYMSGDDDMLSGDDDL